MVDWAKTSERQVTRWRWSSELEEQQVSESESMKPSPGVQEAGSVGEAD
jgi:hypothetical protein